MKLNKLVAASALVFAGLSGQAMATLTAADIAAGPFAVSTTPVVDVYLSGASAPQNILGGLAAVLFSDGNAATKDFFLAYDNAVSGAIGASYRSYQGRLVAAQGTIPAGTMVRLTHRAKGGSVWGVNPVGENRPIAHMPLTSANCIDATGLPLPAGVAAHDWRCGEAGDDIAETGRRPDFGVSDVEPRMFKETLNVEFGQFQLADPGVLTHFPVNGLLFGIPATAAVPATINFTKARYHALLTGGITSWTTLDSTITTKPQVVICRRVQGSGTQASYNAYFNNFPCATGSVYGTGSTAPLRMQDSGDAYDDFTVPGTIIINANANTAANGGVTIIENPSSGNVRTCLARANAGGSYSFTSDDGIPVTVNFDTGGYRAIGTLSLDSSPTADWSFRTLNGVAATKANMRTGQYDFWYEVTMQYNTTVFASFPQNKKDLITRFIALAGDPVILDGLSEPLRSATVALPLNNTPGEVGVAQQNTSYVTHNGNSCQTLR